MTATEPRREAEPPAARRPLLVFVPLVLFAALAALFVIRLYSGDASLLPSALIGRQVPAFALPPVEGLPDKPGFSDADLRQGNVTLVNVFASWCVPCRQEHRLIMRLSAEPAVVRAGVRLFGLAYKDEPANVARFLAEAGDPFANIGADRKGRTAIDWGIYGVPETFVVKGDGTIAYRFVGPIGEESYRNVILPEIEKALR
ncbi:MAG TPA: DsbE family thiol:disulfide interchange protein [Rhizomicrobium sp.]|jgi:cytochrome c biogenesis protein CcmG/thiol:disulfide interchange protein DsbE|nr:DsbE family thiol:disulfide interchange protein [Rhizomicrobium sp.]